MTYEEKRELRLQISQLLADAGLNQKAIKDIVEEEIQNKVERAVEQTIISLNAQSSSGDFVKDRIEAMLMRNSYGQTILERCVKDELKNRVIQVRMKDVDWG